ncbi:uncharacterized protein C1orf43 homolog isoform X1 [Mizuhopecten yessoensis]|uniref:uncharacterized protein C1orf43 homolog isoform X1 n=1 Tax=Mizuhopecten yessoensis TaxID=6573 RepID=UPI000B45B752|nr:uncharacterized protein C1orf43 homolog isoform X1 [Mizuhopecten yessoensis]XP_021357568.1 uncharacterized protein C1orf43 homolog isoform X1 [Mizuhopecten yessoensis]XP_021357569.1 uncharacterized protein C1orf43 homolog isoform X1 [Mizuhopecten yessoensis]XP_021357570.1 uncharacterized protein C1orf43 homolog isoform X1 [Mizuhopecten yessoensis]XP_021357571.1 uncharacterized protein C1orf43 homolog isoform X1 [Mizuhopecten yessoensis]
MSDLKPPMSTVGLVLFIAAGFLLFVLALLLGKRQIMRFSLRSSRRPHISIGSDAPKKMRKSILECLDRVCKIRHEPVLLNAKVLQTASAVPNSYFYRMKALDSFSKLDEVLKSEEPGSEGRHPNKTVRHYLLGLYPDYLGSSSTDLIHQFADAYEHAQHDPTEFGEAQYKHYQGLLDELITCLRNGVAKRPGVVFGKVMGIDTQVIYKPDKGDTQTQTMPQTSPGTKDTSPDKDMSGKLDMRHRTRAGSSAQSSFMDSGHSSHQSTASAESFIPHAESPERIVLLDFDKKSHFV